MAAIDPEQLSDWFDLYRDRLTLYARQWLDFSQSQDVVQEGYIRLMGHPQK